MRIKTLSIVAAAVSAIVVASPAAAVSYFFTDFDDYVVDAGGPLASGGTGYDLLASIQGWSVSGGPAIEVQNGVAGTAFSPINLVELDSTGNSAMSRAIDAGTYHLTYWYSPRPGVTLASNGISVLIDGVQVTNVSGAGGANTDWNFQEYFFTVGSTATLTFSATGTSDSLGGYVDSIGLIAVPEPATWALLISGFGAVGWAMRRHSVGYRQAV